MFPSPASVLAALSESAQLESKQLREREGHMHLPPGRAVGIAPFFCLVILFVVSNFPIVGRAQTKSPQKTTGEAPAAKPEPTPPGQQKPAPEIEGNTVVVNTDLITFTVTVTDTYGRFVSGLSK